MLSRDYRDIITGGALFAMGLFVAIYSLSHYPLGKMTRMGPGMFPTGLGLLLAGFGAVIAISALWRGGTWPEVDVRAAVAVIASVASFAIFIDRIGMVPTVAIMSVLAVAGDKNGTVKRAASLAIGLNLLAVPIFIYGLDLPIALAKWSF